MLEKLIQQYRRSVNPPYSSKDYLTLGATLFILVAIFLTSNSLSQPQPVQPPESIAVTRPIVFKDLSGNLLPIGADGLPYTTSSTIKIELTSPYPPAPPVLGEMQMATSPGKMDRMESHSKKITPTPSPTEIPAPSPIIITSPTSSPTPEHILSPTPSFTPTPTPKPKLTTSYKLTEDLASLETVSVQPYTSEPTVLDYEFKDKNPGVKHISVQFIYSDGTMSRVISRPIELVVPTPTPTPTQVPAVTFKTYKGLNFPWGINSKGTSTFRDWLSSKYDEQVTAKSFEEIKNMGVRTVGMWLWFDRMLIKDEKWGTDAYVTKFDPTYKANWESFLKNVVKAKDMEVVTTMFPGAGGEERDPYMIDRDTFIPVLAGNDILGAGVANGDMVIDSNPKNGLPDNWIVYLGNPTQNSYLYEPGDGTPGSPAYDLKLISNSSSQIAVISPKVPYPYQGALLALSVTYKGNLSNLRTSFFDGNDKSLGEDYFSPNLGMTNSAANWTTVTWASRTVKIPAGTAKVGITAYAAPNGTTSIGPVRIALGARNAKWNNYMQAVKDWVSMYGSNTEYGPAVASWHGIKEVSDGWNFFVTRDFSRDFYQAIKNTGTTQPVGIDNSPYFRLAVTEPNNQPWFNDAADYYSLHMYRDDGVIPDTSKLDKPFILGEFGAENNCPNGGSPEKGDCKPGETNLANPNAYWNLNAVSKFYPDGKSAGARAALGWAWVSNPTIAVHKLDGTNVLGNAGQWIKDWNP